MSKFRTYKGVFYYGSRGKWTCDLTRETFDTLADLKAFISDFLTVEDKNNDPRAFSEIR